MSPAIMGGPNIYIYSGGILSKVIHSKGTTELSRRRKVYAVHEKNDMYAQQQEINNIYSEQI